MDRDVDVEITPQLLLDTMAEGVVVLDPSARIRLWNPAMEQMTGYTVAEATGRPAAWLRAPDCGNAERILALLAQDGPREELAETVDGCECRIVSKTGETIPVLVNARALHGPDGGLLGVLETVTDFRPVDQLRREVEDLQAAMHEDEEFEGMIGHSRPMQSVYRLMNLAAGSDATVLILGESGTGKELAAAAIHRLGHRREGPFVRVNCGALPENLLESELFGHVKGAFTGAYRDRMGRFEAADGGTLFLDEIADITPAMQVKLLRVLQEGEFERVGEARTRRVDVRVVAATNRDLAADVRAGRFREDLYYRLRVFPFTMPPLRERREDIPLLAHHFVAKLRARTGRNIRQISSAAMDRLMEYPWPGNVREMENAVEYAFVVCQQGDITPADLPPEIRSPAAAAPGRNTESPHTARVRAREVTRSPEKLRALLEECDWNKAETARRLGVSRTAVWKWMKQHGIPLQPED